MLLKAVQAESKFQQVASPAAALLGAMLDDGPFIDWFISQVTLRLGMAFNYVSAFLQHHLAPVREPSDDPRHDEKYGEEVQRETCGAVSTLSPTRKLWQRQAQAPFAS